MGCLPHKPRGNSKSFEEGQSSDRNPSEATHAEAQQRQERPSEHVGVWVLERSRSCRYVASPGVPVVGNSMEFTWIVPLTPAREVGEIQTIQHLVVVVPTAGNRMVRKHHGERSLEIEFR